MSNNIKTVSNRIEITDQAVNELVNLNVSKNEFLRLTLVEGGCSGLTYQMTTDTVETPFDIQLFENDKIKVITDKQSLQYLEGLKLDYSSDLIDSGFKFNNPNALSSCGCGNSVKV